MWTLETALDDYLHVIVRTSPWIKRREDELLTGLVEWLYAQPDARVDLASVTPAIVANYAAATSLPAGDQEELSVALSHVFMWAERNGAVTENPFVDAIAA